ncbi:TPA: hypothetical protein HA317_04325 [Candidatus Woesearchaeota archaeon]|nr:hypothetical protein [Candidatus Woesearchaeota archaeon]
MSGFRGLLRDVLIIYVCFRLIFIWLFGAPFTPGLGILVVFLFLSSAWFMLERAGVL